MPSAPPGCASTAAQTGSRSYVRRACRNVATWSMLTPSSITSFPFVVLERGQVLHDAAAEVPPLLEVMVEHAAHQPLRFGRDVRIRIAVALERDQRLAAHDRPRGARLRGNVQRPAIED